MFRSVIKATSLVTRAAYAASATRAVSKISVARFSQFAPQLNAKKPVLDSLTSEIQLEKELFEHKERPEIVDTFLDSTGFQIVETSASKSLAEIVKETATEQIHVFFDVAQVTNIPEPTSLEDGGVEGSEEFDFEKEIDEEFANVNLVIVKKADNSAISAEILLKLDDCSMFIESITPYKDSQLALSESADSESIRQLTYHGPPFSNLDEQLQVSVENYIKELGVDEAMGDFIVAYSEFKENEEYVEWLKSLEKFFG